MAVSESRIHKNRAWGVRRCGRQQRRDPYVAHRVRLICVVLLGAIGRDVPCPEWLHGSPLRMSAAPSALRRRLSSSRSSAPSSRTIALSGARSASRLHDKTPDRDKQYVPAKGNQAATATGSAEPRKQPKAGESRQQPRYVLPSRFSGRLAHHEMIVQCSRMMRRRAASPVILLFRSLESLCSKALQAITHRTTAD
ncbi:hypothetical protein LMG29542_01389 [Paraburkholderia humisilvae]|uniref:Uncharacterized protein n=1 Tax=Paraburkholderia humisilvae TaxID=627669 RepID=A0A6J5DC24_9BURK|nr:hypothetical protein LMG29542_01389 [Paraburkholderia humisilvae]